MKNSSSNYHQNFYHQQLSTSLQEPRNESMVDDVYEQYQICSIPCILNGQITYVIVKVKLFRVYTIKKTLIYIALRESSV